MRKSYFLLICLILVSCIEINNVYCQTEKREFHLGYNFFKDPLIKGKLDCIFAYNRTNLNLLEIGIGKGHRGFEGWGIIYANYHLTTEHSFINNHYLLGTKLGYKCSIMFVNITGQLIYYTDFKSSNFGFRPEIGLTYLGKFDVNYGYNFLTHNNSQTKGHILIIRYTIGNGI
jgi:hypothetical protein